METLNPLSFNRPQNLAMPWIPARGEAVESNIKFCYPFVHEKVVERFAI